jgi:hypothetical protein
MKKTIIFAVAVISLSFLFTAGDSFADREATSYEAAMIYGALKAQGCTVVDEIEVEPFKGYYGYRDPGGLMPGIYKTEAVCYDGERYDIKLDANLNILSKEED